MIVARLVAVERLAAGVELGVVDVVAVAAQAVDVALVDDPDVLQAGEPGAALLDRGEVGVGLDDRPRPRRSRRGSTRPGRGRRSRRSAPAPHRPTTARSRRRSTRSGCGS